MNSPITKNLTGTPCSCAGTPAKSCGCGGGGCGSGAASCQVDTLTRPRFFAGQLLTEDDLQSLEDYVLAKNRLHNRHLFGTGVVCGLQVLCNPCGGGSVTVMPGYALDCCGNDIVLDCQLSLDVNAMIKALRRDQLGGYDCGDPCSDQQRQLDGAGDMPVREYVLSVRYCEQDGDPVSPYAVGEPCNAQSCEMSRVREGIRFELSCPQDASPEPSLIQAIIDCVSSVVGAERVSIYDDQFSPEAFVADVENRLEALDKIPFEDLRTQLLDLIDRSPRRVDCTLRAKVLAAQPAQQMDDATGLYQQGYGVDDTKVNAALNDIFVEILRECVCMALIPPCAPCADTAVPLAGIKVQDCAVVEICNMKRRFVMAPSTLRYWSTFGLWEHVLDRLCCPAPDAEPIRPVQPREQPVYGETAVHTGTMDMKPMAAMQASPPPQATTATRLQSLAATMANLSPGSAASARLSRIGAAMNVLAGNAPAAAAAPSMSQDAIDDAVQRKVAETTAPALAQVDALKQQVADLAAKLNPKPVTAARLSPRPAVTAKLDPTPAPAAQPDPKPAAAAKVSPKAARKPRTGSGQ